MRSEDKLCDENHVKGMTRGIYFDDSVLEAISAVIIGGEYTAMQVHRAAVGIIQRYRDTMQSPRVNMREALGQARDTGIRRAPKQGKKHQINKSKKTKKRKMK